MSQFSILDDDFKIENGVLVKYYGSEKNVVIPNGIEAIGEEAFSYCFDLKTVIIPDGVSSIGGGAFKSCSDLVEIFVPDSVTSIGVYAFENCYELQTISVPNCVTWIGTNAFKDCRSLTSISLPGGITCIEEGVFENCRSLESIAIQNGATAIKKRAFSECVNLKSITIPDSITEVGEWAFYFCESLRGLVLPRSLQMIGDYAFLNCFSLSRVKIPNNVTSIGNHAFARCENLTSITIPEGVKNIGAQAFAGCKLASVTIPDSVTFIGAYAFAGCQPTAIAHIPKRWANSFDHMFGEGSVVRSPYNKISKCLSLNDDEVEDTSEFAVPVVYSRDNKPLYWSADYAGYQIMSFITHMFFEIRMNKVKNDDSDDSINSAQASSVAEKLMRLWEQAVAEDTALPQKVYWYCQTLLVHLQEPQIKEFEAYLDSLLNNPDNRFHLSVAPLGWEEGKGKPVEFELDNEWAKYLEKKDQFNSFEEYLLSKNRIHKDWWPAYEKSRSNYAEVVKSAQEMYWEDAGHYGYFLDDPDA